MRQAPGDPSVGLARSLAALVAPSIEGLIGDVTVAGPSGDGLATIADEAGCGFAEAQAEAEWLRQAVLLAKGRNILLLRAYYVPGLGFSDELHHLRGTSQTAVFRAAPESWHERLIPAFAPRVAAIAPAAFWLEQKPADFQQMIRGLKAGGDGRTPMYRVG